MPEEERRRTRPKVEGDDDDGARRATSDRLPICTIKDFFETFAKSGLTL